MKKMIFIITFLVFTLTINSQTYTGLFKTTEGNTEYHQFVRTGVGAAVYINQTSNDANFPIMRLSSGTKEPNQLVKFTVENNGNVGIGTISPLAGLHLTKYYTDSRGDFISAILGNGYNQWTLFGGKNGGRIRGSNEGYLLIEGNPNGSGDKSLYLNYGSPGNVIIANGGGNVGIGTRTTGTHKLAVEGTIGAREIVVETGSWSDFVFAQDYTLISLEDLEQYIKTNKHLPDVPSEKEVKENGLSLGQSDAVLLQKIEELTLYLIEQNKTQKALIEEVNTLKEKNSELERKMEILESKK